MLSVGLELQEIATNNASLTSMWVSLINATRSVCGSTTRLTYCSNPLTNETQRIGFWSSLDFIGVDWYAPLIASRDPDASKTLPSLPVMIATYESVLQRHLMSWYQQGTFPSMMITESGFPSSNVGVQSPWLPPKNCTGLYAPNFTAQATGYEVAFTVLSEYATSFLGFIQFWYGEYGSSDWYNRRADPKSVWGCGWTPVGKNETMVVLKQAYERP